MTKCKFKSAGLVFLPCFYLVRLWSRDRRSLPPVVIIEMGRRPRNQEGKKTENKRILGRKKDYGKERETGV